jgi:hypothetical protein
VHSVFATALNVQVAGRRGLVTLVGEDGDDLPQGIRLSAREVFDSLGLEAGSHGARTGSTLVLDGGPERAAFVVDLSGAPVTARTAPPAIDPHGDAQRAAWARCAFHLDGMQEERDADLRLAVVCGMAAPTTTLGDRLAEAARELADGVRGRNAAASGFAAARLLGLGGGLTPAGDDFLCGLLAALWCASSEGGEDRRFLRAWGAEIQRRLDATNAISASFLECAIAGCFPGTVTALAAAFAGTPATTTGRGPRASLDRLCALGHSSGMDTATGFLFGLWLRTDDESRRHAP